MTTLGPGEFIILVNVNPSAFPREVREDTAHFRFLKPTSIRPDFQVAEGLRLIILHRVPTEVIDRLRIAAPAIGQRYVKNVGEAMTFVSGIAITQPDNADERRPKLSPKAPRPNRLKISPDKIRLRPRFREKLTRPTNSAPRRRPNRRNRREPWKSSPAGTWRKSRNWVIIQPAKNWRKWRIGKAFGEARPAITAPSAVSAGTRCRPGAA